MQPPERIYFTVAKIYYHEKARGRSFPRNFLSTLAYDLGISPLVVATERERARISVQTTLAHISSNGGGFLRGSKKVKCSIVLPPYAHKSNGPA